MQFLKDYNNMVEITLGNKKVTWPKKEGHIRNSVSML
jgi:preprotein translocase subunit SecE